MSRQETERKRLEQQRREEDIVRQRQIEEERLKREIESRQRLELKETLLRQYNEYTACLESVQKRLRNLRKKLREIVELEERLSALKSPPSKDQLIKIGKKIEICDDIAELEEEEEGLIKRKLHGEFDQILNWVEESDPELSNSSPSENVTQEPAPIDHTVVIESPLNQKQVGTTQSSHQNVPEPSSKSRIVEETTWTTVSNKGKKKLGR